ncbi:MAG: hypothetical protein RIS83_876 [Pseudomonadota bacterium]|jgi:hypothetical protein
MTGPSQGVEALLRRALAKPGPLSVADLEAILRVLGKWRHQLLSNTIIARDGAVVRSGPFAGMRLGQHSAEGCHAPKLLGCYEQALHPHLERFIARGFATVLNIGCAEGYYAIGLARRMPGAKIFAHDLNEGAQQACRVLAEANGVADRITIGGLVRGEDFARFAEHDCLVLVDIEGGEEALLDPVAYPALRQMTLIVECHEERRRGMTELIAERFRPSHQVTRLEQSFSQAELPAWLQGLGHLDQLLAVWEWRMAPTPWLVLEPRPV